MFTLAELETDLTQKGTILEKSIILLESELKTNIENPPLNLQEPALIFIKSTQKTPLQLTISSENSNILEPLESELLDLNEEFKQLRKSKFH